MDNIVDYLVVLFFIISFLSSIFKKKKPTNANAKNGALKTENQIQKVEVKAKISNPFESFVNSINNELVKAKEDDYRSEVDEYYEKAMSKSVESDSSNKNIYQQKEFIEPITLKESIKHEETISIKSYAKSIQQNKARHESKKAKNIRASLMQPNSIKNFIVINEILGKPKALQR